MIIFIIAIALFVISIILILNSKRKKESLEEQGKIKVNSWINILVITNICVMCFFKFILPGPALYSIPTICFFISLLVNIIVLVINNKFMNKKLMSICLIIIYFLLMFVLPVYKLEDHEHIFDYTKTDAPNLLGAESTFPYEEIISSTKYYNCYGITLYRKIK